MLDQEVNKSVLPNDNDNEVNSGAKTDRLPSHSLQQKELEYLCNRGGKTTPSYVDDYVDPDLEV